MRDVTLSYYPFRGSSPATEAKFSSLIAAYNEMVILGIVIGEAIDDHLPSIVCEDATEDGTTRSVYYLSLPEDMMKFQAALEQEQQCSIK